jgi:hypothetical protein
MIGAHRHAHHRDNNSIDHSKCRRCECARDARWMSCDDPARFAVLDSIRMTSREREWEVHLRTASAMHDVARPRARVGGREVPTEFGDTATGSFAVDSGSLRSRPT